MCHILQESVYYSKAVPIADMLEIYTIYQNCVGYLLYMYCVQDRNKQHDDITKRINA